MILSGGSNSSVNTAKKTVHKFEFEVGPQGKLVSKMVALPSMNQRRMKHCQVILKGVLFVFFGHQDTMSLYSDTLEYLDLEDPDASFKEIKIQNYGKPYVLEPMVFVEPCTSDSIRFFGGQVKDNRREDFS